MIEAVIFDLDGTLIHLPIDYEVFYEEVKKITRLKEVKPITRTIASLDSNTRGKVFEEWKKAEWKALQNFTINKKGMKLYNEYSDKPRALVTMQGKELVDKIVNLLKISFNITITREDSLNRLEQIKMAIAKLEKKPENILVIGNTEHDKTSSKEAGCKFLKVEGNEDLV